MPAHLEGLSASIVGLRLTIGADKPLVIKTNTTSKEAGQVVISCLDGLHVLKNGSRLPCRVNGTESQEAVLANGDEIQIGKDRFKVVIEPADDHDQVGTQKLPTAAQPAIPSGRVVCSVCDAPIDQGKRGWSDGDRHICPRCVAKGVKPDHLPRPSMGSATSPTAPTPPADTNRGAGSATPPARSRSETDHTPQPSPVVAEASVASTVSEPPAKPAPHSIDLDAVTPAEPRAPKRPRPATAMSSSDVIEPGATPAAKQPAAGAVATEAHTRANPSGSHQAAGSSDSDRMRHSRRISASRLTAVEPASSREGLFSKVGRVFGRRDERFQRLEDLEAERFKLLAEAGRHALGAGGGLGLSEPTMTALLQGQTVTIKPSDLVTTDLERWRAQHQRMGLLDAEISALRRSLGLGHDPGSQLQLAPDLRPDQKHQQERAFATLDGMATDELGTAVADARGAAPAPEPASSASARQRSARRRR